MMSSNPWTGDGIVFFKPFLLVNHKKPFIPALKQPATEVPIIGINEREKDIVLS